MKKLVLIAVIFAAFTVQAQNLENSTTSSRFEYGILGGVSSATMKYYNSSFLAEGRYYLTKNLGVKISIGYSDLIKSEDYNVKTFRHVEFDDVNEYKTISYDVDKHSYSILPVSIGIEYRMNLEKVSPYCSFEFGVNSYRLTPQRVSMQYGSAGTYSTYNEIPEEYKSPDAATYKGISHRIGFGAGLRYLLAESFYLDVRYLYQINTSLADNHLLLFGITI